MGAFTVPDQVWYPGLDDRGELNVLLATQAASINNGIGARLRLQEVAVGLKAGFTSTVPLTALGLAAVGINSLNGSFAQGLTITGGVVTVATKGMYLVSGSVGVTNIGGHTAKMELRLNSTPLCGDEQKSDAAFYQAAKQTTVVNCVPGDTISLWIGDALGSGATTAGNLALTHLTVAMIQAVP